MGTKTLILLDGRPKTVYFHQEVDDAGGHWATSGPENSDTGWSLHGDGRGALRETYKNGELATRVYVGQWSLVDQVVEEES